MTFTYTEGNVHLGTGPVLRSFDEAVTRRRTPEFRRRAGNRHPSCATSRQGVRVVLVPYTPANTPWLRLLDVLAILSLPLVGVNIYLVHINQALQREVTDRQQFIAQSVQIQQLTRDLANALANLAVKNNDEQIRQVLTSRGITFSTAPPSVKQTGQGRKP